MLPCICCEVDKEVSAANIYSMPIQTTGFFNEGQKQLFSIVVPFKVKPWVGKDTNSHMELQEVVIVGT